MSEHSVPMTPRTRIAAGIVAFVAAMGLAAAAAPPAQRDELDTVSRDSGTRRSLVLPFLRAVMP